MIVKRMIELDRNDIRHAIAREFNVDDSNVDLCVREECTGYGMSERYEYVPYAVITTCG